MPKKNSAWGTNSKAAESRERKADKKREEQVSKAKAQEDGYWKDDHKPEQRKQERKEKEQQKKLEALARKQDARKMLEEEEAKMASATKSTKTPPKKVTHAEIDKVKEKERKHNEELAQKKEMENKRITENPEMEEINPNQKMAELLAAEGAVEARSVDEAISVLNISGDAPITELTDKHPEKRMKAAYNEFIERELPRVKAENPNLRLSQLKQILHKEWQKSPDNPMNKR